MDIHLNVSSSITPLPNGELFCCGKNNQDCGISLIIDKNFEYRVIPSGTPSCWSSAIYFNRTIYCFWQSIRPQGYSSLSKAFDLDKNLWVKLAPTPRSDWFCHSIVFNRNILISGYYSNKLYLYSIDTDSFSILPYDFCRMKRKLLVNADEKLILIEFDGSIYECEDEYAWMRIRYNTWAAFHPSQAYCLYNDWRIYIGSSGRTKRKYFKFSLDLKWAVEL